MTNTEIDLHRQIADLHKRLADLAAENECLWANMPPPMPVPVPCQPPVMPVSPYPPVISWTPVQPIDPVRVADSPQNPLRDTTVTFLSSDGALLRLVPSFCGVIDELSRHYGPGWMH